MRFSVITFVESGQYADGFDGHLHNAPPRVVKDRPNHPHSPSLVMSVLSTRIFIYSSYKCRGINRECKHINLVCYRVEVKKLLSQQKQVIRNNVIYPGNPFSRFYALIQKVRLLFISRLSLYLD